MVFFYFSNICILLEIIASFAILLKKTGNLLNPALFFGFFIYVPFIMQTLNLSVYQQMTTPPMISFVFLFSSSVVLFYSLIFKIRASNFYINITAKLIFLSVVFCLSFLVTYLVENFQLSNSFVPILQGLDIHLDGIRGLREYNSIMRMFVPIFSFYMYKECKKNIFLIFYVLSLLVPLTRGSRSSVMIAIIGALVLTVYEVKLKTFVKIFVLGVLLVNIFVSVGNIRISENHTANTYGRLIGLNDDFYNYNSFGEIFSWYYGYYGLSYYNLQTSYSTWNRNPQMYYGLVNTYGVTKAIGVGKYIPNYPTDVEITARQTIIGGAANVCTAFYFYLMDFGPLGMIVLDLIFISIIFYVFSKSISSRYFRFWYSILLIHIIIFAFYSSFYSIMMWPMIMLVTLFGVIAKKKLIITK